MLYNKWIRYPSGDEMMIAIRCWRPVYTLTFDEVNGQDYVYLDDDGAYERKFHNQTLNGTWTHDDSTLFFGCGDSIVDKWSYKLEGASLYTGG